MKLRILFLLTFASALFFSVFAGYANAEIELSPNSVEIKVGSSALVNVSKASGTVSVSSSRSTIATASYSSGRVTIKGVASGSAVITVKDRYSSAKVEVKVLAGSGTPTTGTTSGYTLVAWNDLGMHCVDGNDYSIFSILPPYNNLKAHLVNKGTGKVITSGVSVTYQSVADSTGSINTISSTKTNFWQYVLALFGVSPAPDVGLTGNKTPSNTPALMKLNTADQRFEADGIPITPVDDAWRKNFYPMVKLVAKDSSGKVIATTQTVLPVSDEMNCAACHRSTTDTSALANAAKPSSGWVFDGVLEKDWKKNILKLHDEKQLSNPVFVNALASKGFSNTGLYNTAMSGKPVLCATCHSSNALPGTGVAGIKSLTQALHSQHASVIDPVSKLSLNDSSNRGTCYLCHPGAVTQCLRGAMGKAVDASGNPLMSCQSCHGSMKIVGSPNRVGWLQEPNCQACHHDSKRDLVAIDQQYGTIFTSSDQRFATNPDVPSAGFSLYRLSKGHGGLNCESCHGPTHAINPSSEINDNVQSIALQGHAGTVAECSVCHSRVPLTKDGGPHGMHTIGNAWVASHGDITENSGASSCAYCHGADFKGSPLSELKVAKTFNVEGGAKNFAAGHKVSCYDCHNGPGDRVAKNLLQFTAQSKLAAKQKSGNTNVSWNILKYLHKKPEAKAGDSKQ